MSQMGTFPTTHGDDFCLWMTSVYAELTVKWIKQQMKRPTKVNIP